MRRSNLFLTTLLLFAGLLSCKKTESVTCDGSAPTYNSVVKNIVAAKCVSCHSAYSTFQGLSTITSSGQFEKEVLIDRTMPASGTLSQDELSKLQCWVENGFPEN